jgi:hypothetical protein
MSTQQLLDALNSISTMRVMLAWSCVQFNKGDNNVHRQRAYRDIIKHRLRELEGQEVQIRMTLANML